MKRRTLSIIAILMVIVLSVAGCGQSNKADKQKGNQTKTVSVKEGLSQLLSSAKNLKTAINQNNNKQVRAIGPKLEEEWSSFEDQIKPDYPDSYEAVEKYLDPAIAGTKVNPIDKKTLLPLVNNLIQAVQDLSKKVNK